MDWQAYKTRQERVRDFNDSKYKNPYPIIATPTSFDAITQEHVHEIFNYDPKTGKLTDKQGKNVVVYGSLNAQFGAKKTLYVRLCNIRITASRVIWLWVYGKHKKVVHLRESKKGLILDNLFIKE